MKNPGGYQLVDFKGTEINQSSAVVVNNSEIANILRSTRKVVYISGLKLGSNEISGVAITTGDTGASAGKIYIMIINSVTFTISTDNNTVTIAPQTQAASASNDEDTIE